MNEVFDSTILDRKLASLISRKQKDIIMTALIAGGKDLQNYTRQSLLKKFPKAATAKGKSNRTMIEEIHIITDKQIQEVMVSVMNYLTKWFEMGTGQRYLKETHPKDERHHKTYKKGESRGSLTGLQYFREARENHSDDVIDTISETVLKLLKNEFENA